MKFSINLVGGGRYYRAGENVPADLVPPHVAVFAVSETDTQPDPVVRPPVVQDDAKLPTRNTSGKFIRRPPKQ